MISERLKTETLSEHKEVEKALRFERSMASSENYKKLLQAFYAFYSPVESTLVSFSGELRSVGLDLDHRWKVPLLKKDLQTLGMSAEEIDQLDLCKKTPPLNTLAQALGVIYVLEGSTLGGQVITKMLKEKKILPHEESCFHNPYGKETMPMWLHFKSILNRSRQEDHDAIVVSAKATFECMRGSLEMASLEG